MGEEYIKKTQDTLGKMVKKPPMTDKLLKKPPFRFLHDVFTEVIRTTGFMKGLFTEAEMDSTNVKDKDAKVALLQKVVDVVCMVTGKALSVRPSKIVAGHEPEKTNELLQTLATALSKKMDSTDSVKKVLNGDKGGSEKPPRPKKDDDKKSRDNSADKRNKENKEKSSSDNRTRSGSRDRLKDKAGDKSREHSKDRERSSKDRDRSGKDRDRSSKDRDRSRDRDRSKDRPKDKEEKGRSSKDKERSREKDKEERSKDKERSRGDKDKEKEKVDSKEKERDKERRERRRRKEEEASQQQTQNEDEEDFRMAAPENEDGGSNRIPRPSSAKGSRRRPTKDDDADVERQESAKHRSKPPKGSEEGGLTADDALPPQVVASRRMARPSSARPAPPRLKKQESTEDNSRIGSGKQVSNVIVDNAHNSEDEDDIFVVEDTQPIVDDEPGPTASESVEDDGEHGGLVKKILETKKELEGTQNKQEDKPVTLDPARRKERELVQREVEKLRGAIQTLTRSANPLGKIMDYLQEDVDSMQKELEMWQRENGEHRQAIKREQGITDSELEPLQAQLAQLDQSIEDQLDTIAAVKSGILRGEEKIGKMVSSIAFTR